MYCGKLIINNREVYRKVIEALDAALVCMMPIGNVNSLLYREKYK